MKYIYYNIKSFIQNDTIVFFLTMFMIIVSSFMIHFSYGVYNNYQIKKENAGDEQDYIILQGNYRLEREIVSDAGQFKYSDYKGEAITIDMLRQFGEELGLEICEHITVVNGNASYFNYNIHLAFSYDEDGFVVSPLQLDNSQMFVVSGRYFTEEEYKNGTKVALAFDERINNGDLPISSEMKYNDTHIKIGDDLYEIIGYHCNGLDEPLISISALPDDTIIDGGLWIYFDKNIDLYTYNKICEASDKAFGYMMTVDKIKFPDVDKARLYNTIVYITILISFIASINFALLYRYIIKRREQQLSYMRLCGLKYMYAVVIYLGECILLTVPLYILSAMVFAKVVLPWISNKYQYGFSYYNNMVYVSLFVMYLVVSLAILIFTIVCNVKKNKIMREG